MYIIWFTIPKHLLSKSKPQARTYKPKFKYKHKTQIEWNKINNIVHIGETIKCL